MVAPICLKNFRWTEACEKFTGRVHNANEVLSAIPGYSPGHIPAGPGPVPSPYLGVVCWWQFNTQIQWSVNLGRHKFTTFSAGSRQSVSDFPPTPICALIFLFLALFSFFPLRFFRFFSAPMRRSKSVKRKTLQSIKLMEQCVTRSTRLCLRFPLARRLESGDWQTDCSMLLAAARCSCWWNVINLKL